MTGNHRFLVCGLGLLLAFGAWACSDDTEPGSTTEQGGTAGSGGSTSQAGSLNFGGSGGSTGGVATAGSAGNASGGGGTQNGGSSSGGATAGSGGQGGTISLTPESGGNMLVKVDGQQVDFDQCRLVRGVADGDLSVDCKLKSGGNSKVLMTLFFGAPGTIDCLNNHVIYYDAAGMPADATGSSGTCSVTTTALPMAKGEMLNATFSASLVGTGKTVMLADGTIAIKAAN